MAIKCVLAMVKPNLTDRIVEAAKKAGASGATVLSATGTGAGEAKTFFGLTLDIGTDVVVFLLDEPLVDLVLRAIEEAGQFSDPGTGVAFVVPVEKVVGLRTELK
jgi:nitrogen regulatory protein P-II 1